MVEDKEVDLPGGCMTVAEGKPSPPRWEEGTSWQSRETQRVLVMEEGCGALAAGRGGGVQVDPPTRPGKPETGPQMEPRWEGRPLYRETKARTPVTLPRLPNEMAGLPAMFTSPA